MTALPSGEPPAVRVGLMIRSTTLRRWQADVVESILDLEGVELSLLIVDQRPTPSRSAVNRMSRLTASDHLLWDLYNNGWVARRARSLASVDMKETFGAVPVVKVAVDKKGYSEYFSPDDIETIRSHDLDVVLRFAFGIIRGPILDVPRHGVWSFHHGDEEVYRGSPPAFWEVVDDQPVTGAILQRLTDRLDGGVVIDKGWFPTSRHSYVRNTDRVHFGGTDWPRRAILRIQNEGTVTSARQSTSNAPIYRRPTNAQVLRFLVTQSSRFVRAQLGGVTRSDHWDLGIVDAPIERFVDPTFVPSVRWLDAAERGSAYAADPFAIEVDGHSAVLYERFDAVRRIGEIWQMTPGDSASRRAAGLPVVEHASYPSVVQVDGRTYCLPQVDADGVPLFEFESGTWRHVADLLPGERLLDPTIVRHDGRWWLFGTRPGRDSLTKLHVFVAERVEGPWTAHRLNPVKTDVRSARPAGTPFVHEGRLYRPAQDCSSGYGSAVSICEVVQLDDHDFVERVVRVLQPGRDWPYPAGVHTLSAAGSQTLIDARRNVFDRHEAKAEFQARLGRLRPRTAADRTAASVATPGPPDERAGGPLRVLAVIDALGEGGTERSLAELVPGLRERGIDVSIAILRSRGGEGVEQMLRDQGVDIHILPTGRGRVSALRALISDVRPDVLHSMLYESNQLTRWASMGLGVPVLTSLVNTSYTPERFATAGTNHLKLRAVQAVDTITGRLFVDRFHAVSETVADSAKQHLRVPETRITVVKRGRTDPSPTVEPTARRAVRRELGIPDDALVVTNVGRHEHQKDHVTLIGAMAPILAERTDVWLVIAGRDGNATQALHHALEGVEQRDRVILAGHRGDIAAVLTASDVFVLSSRHEGLPGAVIEAMAAGLPVVASDIGPVHEVVEAGASALVAPAGDAAAFTRAIERLLDDGELRTALGDRGRAIFEQRFTIDASTDGMARLYRAVAGSAPIRRR